MLHFLSTLCPLVTGEAVRHEVRIAAIIFGLKKKINSNQLRAFALGVKDTTFWGDSNPVGGVEGR